MLIPVDSCMETAVAYTSNLFLIRVHIFSLPYYGRGAAILMSSKSRKDWPPSGKIRNCFP